MAGAFIELENGDLIKLWLHGGIGTNTKGELLGLWIVLFFAYWVRINLAQIVGDSLVIVTSANDAASINALALSSWMDQIKSLLGRVPGTSIIHIFRKHNSVADTLSQRGLVATAGMIFYEIIEGSRDPILGCWNIFVV